MASQPHMKQKQLPLTLTETRAECLRRVLSMADGKLKTADQFTFNEAAKKRATAIARKAGN
jgi:hypothetical protein